MTLDEEWRLWQTFEYNTQRTVVDGIPLDFLLDTSRCLDELSSNTRAKMHQTYELLCAELTRMKLEGRFDA